MSGDDEEEGLLVLWRRFERDIERSIRYHARRECHIARWQLGTKWAAATFSTATFAALAEDWSRAAQFIAVLLTALTTFDIVVGFAQREREHRDLKMQFGDLLADLQVNPTEEALVIARRKRVVIEKNEPPIYRALDVLCLNEVNRAHRVGNVYRISWYYRLTANYFTWPNVSSSRLGIYEFEDGIEVFQRFSRPTKLRELWDMLVGMFK